MIDGMREFMIWTALVGLLITFPSAATLGTEVRRGGIEGEPVALDSKDVNLVAYLADVRRRINARWSFPCVPNREQTGCELKSGSVVIEFGILRSGDLAFIEIRESSGYPIMDEYATKSINTAAPFAAIPDLVMRDRTGTGLPIRVRFEYGTETEIRTPGT